MPCPNRSQKIRRFYSKTSSKLTAGERPPMKFYEVDANRYRIDIHDEHKWGLPGVHCPACGAIWSTVGPSWPCVDLSKLPEAKKLEEPYLEENFDEFLRLREAVRPFVPPGVELKPGTKFGPAIGPASGRKIGALTMGFPWMMLGRPEGVAFLQEEGLRGVKAGPTEYRWKRHPQQVLEFQIEPHSRVHPDCLPPDPPPRCETCGRRPISRPRPLILDLASLPTDLDIFRLADFMTAIVVTERFVEAVQRLGCEDIKFTELAAR